MRASAVKQALEPEDPRASARPHRALDSIAQPRLRRAPALAERQRLGRREGQRAAGSRTPVQGRAAAWQGRRQPRRLNH